MTNTTVLHYALTHPACYGVPMIARLILRLFGLTMPTQAELDAFIEATAQEMAATP